MARNKSNNGNHETGLLTRCVPAKLKNSFLYRWWLRFTRVLQFLSAIISLGIFSSRVYKVYRLTNSVKAQRGISGASKAVEGILAAAVLYTIIATLFTCLLRRGRGPSFLRWIWVLLDIAFVGAFIAVADLTRPNGGPAGPRHCYNGRNQQANGTGRNANSKDQSCNLPWGTFVLAIISTILHAITAAFHEVKDHHTRNKESSYLAQDGYTTPDGHSKHNGEYPMHNGNDMHNGNPTHGGTGMHNGRQPAHNNNAMPSANFTHNNGTSTHAGNAMHNGQHPGPNGNAGYSGNPAHGGHNPQTHLPAHDGFPEQHTRV